jgi:hypothetical protein
VKRFVVGAFDQRFEEPQELEPAIEVDRVHVGPPSERSLQCSVVGVSKLMITCTGPR